MPEKGNVKHKLPSICTAAGHELNFLTPDRGAIDINDIAEALAKCARYAGHTPGKFYSVAEHSVIMSRLVPSSLSMQALLHDASEAYMGDCASPLKWVIGPEWKKIENRLTRSIFEVFGVKPYTYSNDDPISPAVHDADYHIYTQERLQLMPKNSWWKVDKNPEPGFPEIKCLEWREAKQLFLDRFYEL